MLKYEVHGEGKGKQHKEPGDQCGPCGCFVLRHQGHEKLKLDPHGGRQQLFETCALSQALKINQHHLPCISGHLQMHKAHVAMANVYNTRLTNQIPV